MKRSESAYNVLKNLETNSEWKIFVNQVIRLC